jgi:type II secretory pathway component PulC
MGPEQAQPVVFNEVSDTDDLTKQRMIEKNRLLSALHFLTKVDPPPQKEIVVVSAPKTEPKSAPPPPPPPPPFDPKIKLLLVSYDDIDGNHLAFVSCEDKPSHPYLVGEKLPSKPVTVIKEIYRQSILVVTEDGKKRKQIYTQNAIIQKVTRSNLNPPDKNSRVVVPTKNGSKSVSVVAKTRRVPRSRSVDINKEYGVSIVEYDPTPDGEKRYAISQKDLKALENQKLRLLSEVFMQPAYDGNGDPLGIKLDFVADNPLAKSYGIQNGDVLETINGKQVTDAYQAESLYTNISSKTRRVQVGINRGGSRFNVWYEMDDFPATPDRNK